MSNDVVPAKALLDEGEKMASDGDSHGADDDDDAETLEELRHSFKVYGPIRPVIRTRFGIASGETRKKAVPEWPEQSQEVKTYLDHLKLKVADNLQRDKSTAWWEQVINDVAKEYEKMGTPKGEISRRLIDDFGLTKSRVERYLRPEYKQPEKVEAGSRGGRPRLVVSRETRSLEEIEPEPSNDADRTDGDVVSDGDIASKRAHGVLVDHRPRRNGQATVDPNNGEIADLRNQVAELTRAVVQHSKTLENQQGTSERLDALENTVKDLNDWKPYWSLILASVMTKLDGKPYCPKCLCEMEDTPECWKCSQCGIEFP